MFTKTESRQIISCIIIWIIVPTASASATEPNITFIQPVQNVECYDFFEVIIKMAPPLQGNPFTEVNVSGEFGPSGRTMNKVDGFCDSNNGSIYRIRFMPEEPGKYEYTIRLNSSGLDAKKTGVFEAQKSKRKGIVRTDPEYPWHFIWSGSGEHFFWNSTTTYWLLGWQDEAIIRESLNRLALLKVNRIRVALNGRTRDGMRWKEPNVMPSGKFQYRLEPWPAAHPDDVENPDYNVDRFNIEHFRKCERMLAEAARLGIQVSLIFYLDGEDKGVDPFGKEKIGETDEQRYYRYVVARMAAYENVMWDVTNEWHLFRNEKWVEKMGNLINQCDPYNHLISVHGREIFPFRKSPWCDFAMYQCWDEHGGYSFMLKNRREQEKTGRPMPQVNEEYGYEDHYPYPWGEGRRWPARTADNRRRLAWEMTMAGGYQTTGERADVKGYGGWITGWGNDEMIMLQGYARMMNFFTSVDWWTAEPAPELVMGNARCLASPGRIYLVYLPKGGTTQVKLEDGQYNAKWYNPREGAWSQIDNAATGLWTTPSPPDEQDWGILIESKK